MCRRDVGFCVQLKSMADGYATPVSLLPLPHSRVSTVRIISPSSILEAKEKAHVYKAELAAHSCPHSIKLSRCTLCPGLWATCDPHPVHVGATSANGTNATACVFHPLAAGVPPTRRAADEAHESLQRNVG